MVEATAMRVLYVAENDLNSTIALDLAGQAEQGVIHKVQYVEALRDSIPTWLTGVPSLACTSGELLQGSECIRFLASKRGAGGEEAAAPATPAAPAAPPAPVTSSTAAVADLLEFDAVLPDVDEPPTNSEKGVDMDAVKKALAERGIS